MDRRSKSDLARLGTVVGGFNESPPDAPSREEELRQFEGAWVNLENGGHYDARVLGGKLRIAYSFLGDLSITGEMYDCRVVGRTLFVRYRWTSGIFRGIGLARVVSRDRLEGGWWFQPSIPPEVDADILKLDTSMRGMNPWTWQREQKPFPQWAEDYLAAEALR